MDMSKTIVPKSDQMNYDDFPAGPKTITITGVKGASNENDQQPVSVHYEGDNGKPYKPCKSMRRVMVAVWGVNAIEYVGKSMTLFGDPNVLWAGKKVGGIRISHMSHIKDEINLALTASKGRRLPHRIQPLKIDMSDPDPIGDESLTTSTNEAEPYETLYERAKGQAENGVSAYEKSFMSLRDPDRKKLIDSGDHQKLKDLAEKVDQGLQY